MILDKLAAKKDFTHSEKEIAAYLLNHLSSSTQLSAYQLGQKTFTSKATVIRFCKKLNFSGYQAFKEQLALEVNEKLKLELVLAKEPVTQQTTLTEIFTIVPTIYENTLTNINLAIDEVAFKRIISHLRKSASVDLYGAGITYACATAAAFKFQTLGIKCNAYSGINEHYVMATRSERNRVAIVLSFTGANHAMVAIAKYLKANGVFVIGIGGNEVDHLRKYCDEYVELFSKELVMSMEVVTPFIAITYIFDLLFTSLLVADFDQHVGYALDVLNYQED